MAEETLANYPANTVEIDDLPCNCEDVRLRRVGMDLQPPTPQFHKCDDGFFVLRDDWEGFRCVNVRLVKEV